MTRVEDGDFPDAAEVECQWSKFVSTDTSSADYHTRDSLARTASDETGDCMSDTDGDEHVQQGAIRSSVTDMKQRTKSYTPNVGSIARIVKHKRPLAPVDEGI